MRLKTTHADPAKGGSFRTIKLILKVSLSAVTAKDARFRERERTLLHKIFDLEANQAARPMCHPDEWRVRSRRLQHREVVPEAKLGRHRRHLSIL
jgi:hypothetical protein